MILEFPTDKVEKAKKKKEAQEFLDAIENAYSSKLELLQNDIRDLDSMEEIKSLAGVVEKAENLHKTALETNNLEVALGCLELMSSINMTILLNDMEK